MRTRSKPRVQPIEPDEGLMIAVQRYAGGAVLHFLLQMADRYLFACAAGNCELADEIKIAIYRKMREGRLTDAEKRNLAEAEKMI